jgi:hypothetical protein
VTSPSASALRVRETRAIVLGADVPATSVGQRAGWDALDDLFATARRVHVMTGR